MCPLMRYLLASPEKTTDIWRRYHWFPAIWGQRNEHINSFLWRVITQIWVAKINNTGVKYVETCNLQKVCDSSDSLNGNSCFATINLYSFCNSNDQRRIFKMTECNHRGKGERNEVKKGQIWPISYFWIRSLSLRRNHLHTNLSS